MDPRSIKRISGTPSMVGGTGMSLASKNLLQLVEAYTSDKKITTCSNLAIRAPNRPSGNLKRAFETLKMTGRQVLGDTRRRSDPTDVPTLLKEARVPGLLPREIRVSKVAVLCGGQILDA